MYSIYYIVLQHLELRSLIKEFVKSKYISLRLLYIIDVSLLKIYPKFVQSKLLTIDDLLEWEFWPKILTYFGMVIT